MDSKDTGSKSEASGSKNVDESNAVEDQKLRRPRRERPQEEMADEKGSEIVTGETTGAPLKPARRRRAADPEPSEAGNNGGGGGWMSSPDKKTASKLTIEEDDESKDVANPNNKEKFFQETHDDIMIIPDLDEDGYDDDHRVAHAPRNINRKIPTLLELENEVKSAIPSAEGGLDLGVLLRTLVPAQFVQEADVTWSFESLLRDITDEFTAPSRSVVAGGVVPATPTGKVKTNNSSAPDRLKEKDRDREKEKSDKRKAK